MGEVRAVDTLERYRAAVVRHLTRRHIDPEMAEDAVQDLALQMARAGTVVDSGVGYAYMVAAAWKRVGTILNNRKEAVSLDATEDDEGSLLDFLPDPSPGPADLADTDAVIGVMADAVAGLGDRDRQIVACLVKGKSVSSIALRLALAGRGDASSRPERAERLQPDCRRVSWPARQSRPSRPSAGREGGSQPGVGGSRLRVSTPG
jgi:DNA-directed RNA polymerase specialized sigma24 family protein